MLRRLLPLILAASLSTLLFFAFFQNVSWHALPLAIGLGRDDGPTAEEIASGENILPDLRAGKPDLTKPYKDEDISKPGASLKMPYPEGQTKPPGSNYTRHLVLAKTHVEDTTWVEKELGDLLEPHGLLTPAIYVVDDKSAPLHPPKNAGHEVMVYLSYIIDFYDRLPDIAIFMHHHQFAWHNNELLETDAAQMVRHLSPERVTRLGYMNLRCHWDPGCPSWLHPGTIDRNYEKQEEHLLAQSWAELFPLDPIPTILAQPCCAQFAVSRERILATPKQRYIHMRDWVEHTELSDYLSGRIFEYLWQYIFSDSPTHCPSMSACYCDGYGICFGGHEPFNEWFKLRYEMNEMKEELRLWWEKADLIEEYRKHTKEGKLAEEALLEVPTVGRDKELEQGIAKYWKELEKRRMAAFELGRDPRQRALEAGREWKEGDGY